MKLTRALCLVLLCGASVSGQSRSIALGSPVEREIQSGEMHEYTVSAGAGDLVAGTFEWRRLSGFVNISTAANLTVHTQYFSATESLVPQRIGFVAPSAGEYRVRIEAFDRFDSGPQTAPGALIGIVGTARGSYILRLESTTVAARMLGVNAPLRERYSSTRLQRLSQDLQQGRAGALESFWHEVSGKGPLVEQIPGNDREIDVTFLWREIYDTRNVLVLWPMATGRPDDYFMSRLPGTDIWHKTLRLRHGTRFEYGLSVNDRPEDRWATAVLDPLNPRRFPDDPTYPFPGLSVLDTPGAPDERWALEPPTRRGQIEEKTITSGLLKNERPIWVYTPPGYTRRAGPYPLVLLFDGAAYVSSRFGAAPTTFDNLINDGRIRPAIVCFDPGNRGDTQGLSGTERYSDALVQELLPMLRSDYPISTNPADITVGGYSAGGRAAAHVAFRHPEAFGNVLSQSGSFRQREPGADEANSTAQLFLAAPRKPIRFYLEVGLYDAAPNTSLPLDEMLLDETNLMRTGT
jgi:enterochelin esterase family protein